MRIEWKNSTGTGSSGQRGWLGNIKIFDLQWGITRRDDGRPWVLYCELPGYQNTGGRRRTWPIRDRAEAADVAEKILDKWLEGTGLTFKEETA